MYKNCEVNTVNDSRSSVRFPLKLPITIRTADMREHFAETADRRAPWGVIALAGRAQRGQCLDPGGVKRRPVIQRDEDPVAQRQPQPPRHAVTDRRVRRVAALERG